MARDNKYQTLDRFTELDLEHADQSQSNRTLALYKELDEVLKEVEEKENARLSLARQFSSVADDEIAKIKEQSRLEEKRKKEILALNKKIHDAEDKRDKAKENSQAKQAKAASKEVKDLEKRLKLLEKVQKKEEKISDIRKKYQDQLDLINKRESARQDASKLGSELMQAGYKSFNPSMIWQGFKLWGVQGGGFANSITKAIAGLNQSLDAFAKKLDTSIEAIVRYKSDWDTRLLGSGKSFSSVADMVTKTVGASPFVKQEDLMKNLASAIDAGIAFDVEQRAFLQTVKDDIASTFDAFDSTLLQIIRVQQSDSTAARLGMESALNQYLNNMFKSTEYLSTVSDSVTSALYSATSLLSSQQSVGFEYQVQKWLGSLYSVGMSSQAVSSIANALGNLASGNISDTSSGAGKLLVMSASRAGLPYGDLLTQSINDSDINSLMKAMVSYLQEIANSNKVVQSQYASMFGLNTADIVAAGNLTGSINNISQYNLNYSGAVNQLSHMGRTIGERLSLGEMMSNAASNFQYSIAEGIANSPAMYALWEVSGLLEDYLKGIPIPTVSVLGNMVDLKTSVAGLMRVGTMGASLMKGIGSIVDSLGDAFAGQGIANMLNQFGVGPEANTITRGAGFSSFTSGSQMERSASSFVGNTAGSDLTSGYMMSAEDQKAELQLQATGEDVDETKLSTINESILAVTAAVDAVLNFLQTDVVTTRPAVFGE